MSCTYNLRSPRSSKVGTYRQTIFDTDCKLQSGSIVYEWIEETNNYGLISYGPSVDPTATGSNVVAGFTRQGTPTPVSPDFSNLKAQWATLNPTGIMSSDMDTKSLSTRPCPASTTGSLGWLLNGDVQLPTVGETLVGTTYATSSPTGSSSSNGASDANSTSTSASSTSTSESLASPGMSVTNLTAVFLGLLMSLPLML
jgi:1,3-beta-glucanosyltransferase GAS1